MSVADKEEQAPTLTGSATADVVPPDPEVSIPDLMSYLTQQARERLGDEVAVQLSARAAERLPAAVDILYDLYAERADVTTLARSLLDVVLDAIVERPAPLRELDDQRAGDPGWFLRSSMIGYVCYADRFAGTLHGVEDHLDYLSELGVTYLHLMPLLAAREGESDGGYAVRDYDAVEPVLGTMTDLSELADDVHRRGTALVVDLAINHTAREHEWAQRAIAGEQEFRDYYFVFPDREMPDAYERTTPDIFPNMAPGSFTHVDGLGWVWTTFREFQWDLDYHNPAVFRAMLDVMLTLANRGPDVLRIDAAPFVWKRLGTSCMDQPEAHLLLQAFRALTWIAAPGVLLKAEAMLEPDAIGKYLGDHDIYQAECDLAYDNQVMVMLWSTLATGDARLATQALSRRRPAPRGTSWVTYARCHDDIGWAVADTDAAAVGLEGRGHRAYLSEFFAGEIEGSFARGLKFQANAEGASPISGTAASLCGLEAALDAHDDECVRLALRRLETLYSVVFSVGGIPLIYMGDELALLNDDDWELDPAHQGDNRWMHRPPMDWAAADQRSSGSTIPGEAFARMRALSTARASIDALGSNEPIVMLRPSDPSLLAYRRGSAAGQFVAVANFGSDEAIVDPDLLAAAGIGEPQILHQTLGFSGLTVPAYGFVWLSA